MRIAIGIAAMLALAACGSDEQPKNEATPTPTPTPGPKLAGIDLNKPVRASGTGWTLDIAPGRLTYQAGKTAAVELYPIGPILSADRARYVTKTTDGAAATIDLIAKDCGDAPLTAAVAIGPRTLKGCAQAR